MLDIKVEAIFPEGLDTLRPVSKQDVRVNTRGLLLLDLLRFLNLWCRKFDDVFIPDSN